MLAHLPNLAESIFRQTQKIPACVRERSDILHLSSAQALAAVAFGRKAMELGPWVGVFSGKDLIGVAGVHFSTPWVTEIGHAAVHTEFRRMGCARALLSRQIELLANKTKHITACCFQESVGPQNLLESVGFRRHEQVWLIEFSVG